MNKQWKYLIFIGIAVLAGAIAWEIYEVASGDRVEFNLVVLEMPRTTLFPTTLEAHLKGEVITPVSSPF